jgi:magnesium transporter
MAMAAELNGAQESSKLPKIEVVAYQRKSKPEGKKQLFVKEISKVLTDIEETKKSRKIIFFSQLYKNQVIDSTGKKIGYLKDLAIAKGDRFPEVSHIIISRKRQTDMIPWDNVRKREKTIYLDRPYKDIDKSGKQEDDVFIKEHILDKQVVDVTGLKLIRVNDVALTQIKGKLAVVNLDIGTKAIFRRLGFEKLAEFLPFNISDHPVPWESVEPLSRAEKIHLKVQCGRVSELHPADIAEMFDELSGHERKAILRSMKSETAAEILIECEPEVQKSIIRSLKTKRMGLILEKMSANSAANLLSQFPRELIDPILKTMQKAKAEQVQEMLSYEEDTSARYMNESFIEIGGNSTAEEAINLIRKLENPPERLYYIYVVDDDRILVGVASLRRLVLADPTRQLSEIMISKPLSVEINDPIEYAGELVTKYDLMAIPVVDIYGKIRGIINIDDILDVVIDRAKADEPIELTDEEKEDLIKEKKIRIPFHPIRDVGAFIKWLDSFRQKKKNGKVD